MKSKAIWVGALALLLTVGGASAAHAGTTDGDDEYGPLTGQELRAEVNAIPNDAARAAADLRVAELEAMGADVLSVQYAEYAPVASQDQPAAVAMALPPGCGMTGYVWYYGGAVRDELATDCGSTTYSKLTHFHRIDWRNPYNPYDYGELSSATRIWGAGTGNASTLTWGCQNTNETVFYGFGRGTINYGGSNYVAEVGDVISNVPCGW